MMKPWQRAKKWHMENGGDIAFEELLGMFMRDGYVWSSPDEFILAKKIRVEDQRVVDGPVNTWFVWLGAGKKPFSRFLELAPEKLPFVMWQRRGQKKPRIYEWDKFERKTNYGK
jgi:hypothetical protein